MSVFKDRDQQENNYNFMDSAVDALSPMNILKRVFLFLVFGVLLGLKYLIQNIDRVGRTGGGFLNYVKAISSAMWSGVVLSLGSMWAVIINPSLYFETHSYGSIAFALFSLVVLVMFFYQPVSLIINIIDGRRGHATGVLLRLFVTSVFVLILSCITFYAGGQQTLVTPTGDLNNTITNATTTVVNTTINTTQGGNSIISLL